MLIKLPISLNDRTTSMTFQVIITDSEITITPYASQDKLLKICQSHSNYGFCVYTVYFPLVFKIYNNYLVNELFFIFALLYDKNIVNDYNFLVSLVNTINLKSKKKYTIPVLEDFNKKFFEYFVKTFNGNNDTLDNFTSVEHFLRILYLKVNYHLNLALLIVYLKTSKQGHNYNLTKKINTNIKNLYNFKIHFYGNYNTIENHIELIKNPTNILPNTFYFIKKGDRLLKVFLNKITTDSFIINNDKTIPKDKYLLLPYPDNYTQYICTSNLFKKLIDYNLIKVIGNNIYKKNPLYKQILEYFYCDDKYEKLALIKLISNKINNIEPQYKNLMENSSILMEDNISFDSFKEITDINNQFDIRVFKSLVDNYTYPINYDRRTLSVSFAKILYYSFKFIDNIVNNKTSINVFFCEEVNTNINQKLKYIYTAFIKIYLKIQDNDLSFIYNSKLYTDYLHYTIFNILLFNDTFSLFEKNSFYYLLKKKFINNIIVIQAINLLSWKNIPKRISYLKLVLANKTENNPLIFYENKINKFIVDNQMDSRIKNIIVDPLIMFNYLKTEKDYIKWIFILDNDINKIFYTPIKMSRQDNQILGKIIYMLFKVKNQNLEDSTYINLLEYCKKNQHLILYKERINIRLKDFYKNSPINLGYLAKHLCNHVNSSITLTDEKEYSIDELQNKLIQVTKRYYKYKTKYLNIKLSELSSNIEFN